MGANQRQTKPRGPQGFAPLPKGTKKHTFNDMKRNATRHSCVQCTMFDTHGDRMKKKKPCDIANLLLPTRTLIRVPIPGNSPIPGTRCWPLRHLSGRLKQAEAGATRTIRFVKNPSVICHEAKTMNARTTKKNDRHAVFYRIDLLRRRTQKRITHTRDRQTAFQLKWSTPSEDDPAPCRGELDTHHVNCYCWTKTECIW